MNQQVRLSSQPTDCTARFSTAEFVRMLDGGAFEDMKVELVRGELQRMNPPRSDHSRHQTNVLLALASIFGAHRVLGEIGIDLGDDTIMTFDAAVLIAELAGNRFLRPGDVLLGVEIATTTQARDTGPKRLAYAAAGIPHYWVVDSQRCVTHVYGDPVEGDYAEVRTVRFAAPLDVPGSDGSIILG